MWLMLRLFSAAIAAVLRLSLGKATPEGDVSRNGIRIVYRQKRHKGQVTTTLFGLPFQRGRPLEFRLTAETFVDRFFKRIGFSREIQTGDERFDAAVYIACDHLAMESLLRENAEVRRAILDLFAEGNLKRIYADGEHLWVERSGDNMPDDRAARQLNRLQAALEGIPEELLQNRWASSLVWRATLVEAVAWATACYGIPGFFEAQLGDQPLYFDWSPVIAYGLVAAVGIFALLLWFAWWLLRGSSRSHRVFMESFLVLAIGVPFSSIMLVSDANIYFDNSPGIAIKSEIGSRYTTTTRSRRSTRTVYHMRLNSVERARYPIPAELEVAQWLYEGSREGQYLAITFRKGALGIPWVERLAVSPYP